MDTRTPEQRRRIMQAVKSGNTKPELVVRRLLHGMGYRYRLHRKDLPGRPDIALISRRRAIFVHGCFWHGHNCRKGRLPKSRLDYWGPKLERNKERDEEKTKMLESLGWAVLVIWQCETGDLDTLSSRLRKFVGRDDIKSRSGGDCCSSDETRIEMREAVL
jgi:DNA mismatch endonuclease (patch repair protein)